MKFTEEDYLVAVLKGDHHVPFKWSKESLDFKTEGILRTPHQILKMLRYEKAPYYATQEEWLNYMNNI